MNTYAEACLSNASGEVILRGDASEVRAEILAGRYSIDGGLLRFTGFIGDDLAGGSSSVISYQGKWLVGLFAPIENDKRSADTECFDSLSTAMRLAHGWCIAD